MNICCCSSDLKLIYSFIKNGVDLSYRDKKGLDALQCSISNPKIYVIKYLIKHGVDIHTKDNEGRNILFRACLINDNLEKIKYILSLGIDINEKDNSGYTVLDCVLVSNRKDNSYKEIIKFLISEGAELSDNTLNKVKKNDITLTRENLSVLTEFSDYILKNVEQKHLDIITFLKDCSENVDISHLESYLNKDGDLSVSDIFGYDALHYSVLNKNLELAKYLIKRGANIYTTNKKGSNLLHTACYIRVDFEFLEYLLTLGIDINAKDDLGNTPLILASEKDCNTNVIDILIKNGADISARNNCGYDALIKSVTNRNPRNFHHLIEAGADLHIKTKDKNEYNILIFAILNKASRWMVKNIIQAGIDVNEKDNLGNTALYYASKQGNQDLVKALIEEGALSQL